jgi:hypothetical protein
MEDGERKARVLQCVQWRVQLNALHAEAWGVALQARTANVSELARAVTRLSIVMREVVDELQRDAGVAQAYRDAAAMRQDPFELAEAVLAVSDESAGLSRVRAVAVRRELRRSERPSVALAVFAESLR